MPSGSEMPVSASGTAPGSAIVLGAGVVGTACALQLARAGIKTTLVDWQDPGSGASSGNAGSLSAQSIVPIALPGMLRQVPKWLLDPAGPLHVRWRYLPRAAPWLWKWLLASRMDTVHRSAAALHALLGTAIEDFEELLGPTDAARLIRRRGQLLVWRTARPDRTEAIGHGLRELHDVDMEWLTPPEIADLEPALAPVFARGLLLRRHGHLVDPLDAVQTLARHFHAAGGTFVKARATDIDVSADRSVALWLDSGQTVHAARLVIAAGAWSTRLTSKLGLRIPLETERGYHATFPGVSGYCTRPVMDVNNSTIVTPMAPGLRVAGTVEIAGVDSPPDYRRAEALLPHFRTMFANPPEGAPTFWMGCRPSLPDSIPVIDRVDGLPNVVLAFGHGHLGMTGAPGTARIVRDLVMDRPINMDISVFRSGRFG